MSISQDISINVNIDIYKEHRKISKKIREIHRLSIKSNKLSIDEFNKVNRLPELELYLKKIELNKHNTQESDLSETINTKPLQLKPITNNKYINMFTSEDNNQINQDIIDLEKNIENVNAYIQDMNEKYPNTHSINNNNSNNAQHTTTYPSTVGMYASPLHNKLTISDKEPSLSIIVHKDMICGKTMNPIYSAQQVGHHLLSKKQCLIQTTDSSLSNSAKGYRKWLLSVYNNNWEKYHSIEELDWICSFLESLN